MEHSLTGDSKIVEGWKFTTGVANAALSRFKLCLKIDCCSSATERYDRRRELTNFLPVF